MCHAEVRSYHRCPAGKRLRRRQEICAKTCRNAQAGGHAYAVKSLRILSPINGWWYAAVPRCIGILRSRSEHCAWRITCFDHVQVKFPDDWRIDDEQKDKIVKMLDNIASEKKSAADTGSPGKWYLTLTDSQIQECKKDPQLFMVRRAHRFLCGSAHEYRLPPSCE